MTNPVFRLLLIILLIFHIARLHAQIQLRPLPMQGFEQRIDAYVRNMEIVDTHEHLMPQESVKDGTMLDFMLLLHHYADDDIKSAGLNKAIFAELLTDKYSVIEKWEIVKPYWEASKNTAYGRVVLLAIDELYGISELSDATVEEVSAKIKAAYDGPWYDEVLKKRAIIKYAIMDVGSTRLDDSMFRYVEKFDEFIRIHSKEDIMKIGGKYRLDVSTFELFDKALEAAFDQAVARNIVGVKSALAYHRILHYENVSEQVAGKVFNWVMSDSGSQALDFEIVKPLQDYMMHRIIQLARKHGLPMQFHTGLQAGDGNIISNANPSHLNNLFLQYRDVRFLLMHGAYPYGGELSALAKNFQNVYIDMCWMYIISPSYSERYLHEWLETVPANKIMAFGGDYHNVENTLGHALMARAVISKVLVEKVRTAYLTEDEAIEIANWILHDNPIAFFGIE
jgi:uncharacterized protein